jgi:hypothetical protein
LLGNVAAAKANVKILPQVPVRIESNKLMGLCLQMAASITARSGSWNFEIILRYIVLMTHKINKGSSNFYDICSGMFPLTTANPTNKLSGPIHPHGASF